MKPFLVSIAFCLFLPVCSSSAFAAEAGSEVFETAVEDSLPAQHGNLHTDGCQLKDSDGETVQLCGVSTFEPSVYTADSALMTLRDDWNVNTIRLCVDPCAAGGYCSLDDAEKQSFLDLYAAAAKKASDAGLYVILDWECGAGDPSLRLSDTVSFFSDLSSRFAQNSSILYEICGSPDETVSWDSLCAFLPGIIDEIRRNDPDSVILVGTPSSCLDTLSFPINRENLLYSLCFCTAEDSDAMLEETASALENGFSLFVSDFSVSDSFSSDTEEGDLWLSMLNYYSAGYVMGELSSDKTASCLLQSGCSDNENWTFDDLTPDGQWYVSRLTRMVALPEYRAALSEASLDGSNESFLLSNGSYVTISTFSWTDSGLYCTEYDFSVSNPGPSSVNSWILQINWASAVTLQSGWSCQIGAYDTCWRILPVDYNQTIPAGSEADFGFIASGVSAPSILSVTSE